MDLCLLPKITALPPHTYTPFLRHLARAHKCLSSRRYNSANACTHAYTHLQPVLAVNSVMNNGPRDSSHMSGSGMKHSALSWLSPDGPLPTPSVARTFCKSRCYTVWMLSNKSAVQPSRSRAFVTCSPWASLPACLAHYLGRPRFPYSCAARPSLISSSSSSP